MHIKQVIISGFRSFRSQSEIEAFSPKHNAIVGRNGSGKSNFFDAIQFVLLGPKFANLRQEDRQQLLHEGAGSSVMAAYVEIIFDNSDGRLSVESDEVVLRRTVGLKKDEFFLNRKRVQKSEVYSLLESAGFSKSNPYYIVQQGKVSNLCVMKDKDRLELLKEVAGTTVYDERRSESLKIMLDSESKQVQIDEVLQFIEDRLNELEQEKDELKEYDHLDKSRRALEFNIYDKELNKASDALREMESQREEEREQQQNMFAALREAQDKLQKEEDDLSIVKAAFERLQARRQTKIKEVSELQARKSSTEVAILEHEASLKAQSVEQAELAKKLAEVTKLVDACEAALAQISPEYEKTKGELSAFQKEMETVTNRIEALYGKQGRGRQFTSKSERDTFLQTQINKLDKQLDEQRNLHARLGREVTGSEKTVDTEEHALGKATDEQRSRLMRYEELNRVIQEKIHVRNSLQDQRKAKWRDLEIFQEQIQEVRGELERGKQQLNSTIPRSISMGLAVAEQVAAELNLEGYYGPLIDNFELKNDAFRTAVEVAAGNALFYIIVDTDATASILIKELDKRKGGRLTFLPLNRLRMQEINYPDSNDVRPLVDVALTYDVEYEVAIREVFGRKLLARDLDIAAHFSKEYQLDAITKDGDVVSHKGGFEGGYRDERDSKIGAVFKIREATHRLSELSQREAQLKAESDAVENSVNDIMRDLQKLETERDHLKSSSEQLSKELANRKRQVQALRSNLEIKANEVANLNKEMAAVSQQIAEYQQEQSMPLLGRLNDVERDELHTLLDRKSSLQSLLETTEIASMEISGRRDKLKADLTGNLMKRKEEIENGLLAISGSTTGPAASSSGKGKAARTAAAAAASASSITAAQQQVVGSRTRDVEAELTALQAERAHVLNLSETLDNDVRDIDGQLEKKKTELTKLERSVEQLRNEETQTQEQIADGAKVQDKLLNKRTMLLDIVTSKQRLIRDLGTLPRRELEEFKTLSERALLAQLKDVNERLKKYSSVNRKALDQYVSFSEQRETLKSRKQELKQDNEAINRLISTLNTQKEEAILRTFRGVSHHFSEVFAELVPGGEGKLVMKTLVDGEDAMANAGASDEEDEGGDNDDEDDDDADDDEEDEGKGVRGKAKGKAKGKGKRGSKGSSKKQKNSKPSGGSNTLTPIESFKGVQVQVKFTGTGQLFDMQQLSGGQKALVALTLIFAIQRCDPAPFYLFDEIDQALDANYRTGVARLIQKQVESPDAPAQFITTSFRPELVSVANKCYGIALQNKVSNIYPLEQADAYKFVVNLMQEEEALGQVSSVPNFPRSQSTTSHHTESEPSGGEDDYGDEDDEGSEHGTDEEDVGEFQQAEQALQGLVVGEQSGGTAGGRKGSKTREEDEDEDAEEDGPGAKSKKRSSTGSRRR